MNYIRHHKNVFAKMAQEKTITSIDISIYNALFMYWNYSNFCETISISRSEVMFLSKVGNANTYTKSLQRLHDLKYIIYIPSKSPLIGSKVTMCRYDTSGGKSSDVSGGYSTAKSYDTSGDNSGDTIYKQYNNITEEQIKHILDFYDTLSESEIKFKISEFKELSKKDKIDFNIFWDMYDKKEGDKKSCIKKWNELPAFEQSKIIETLPNFNSNISDRQYKPLPTSYLNQRRWEDEIIIQPEKPKTLDEIQAQRARETNEAIKRNGLYPQ